MMAAAPDYSLVPFGPDYQTVVLPLVPELRQRVAATLPPGSSLWGGDLLNADDAAGTHLLAKCVRRSRSFPGWAGAHASCPHGSRRPLSAAPGSCARAT